MKINHKHKTIGIFIAVFLFVGIGYAGATSTYANSYANLPINNNTKQICSSYGSYPMGYAPSTTELCVRNQSGNGPNNVVWSATMVSTTRLVVAYWGAPSVAAREINPSYVANVVIVPNSENTTCSPRTINKMQECVVINFGNSFYVNNIYYVMTGLNGYEVPSPS